MTYKEALCIHQFAFNTGLLVDYIGLKQTSHDIADFIDNDSITVAIGATKNVIGETGVFETSRGGEFTEFKAAIAFAQFLATWKEL